MKAILTLGAVILLVTLGVLAWKFGRSETHFGKPFAGFPSATIPELLARPEAHLRRDLRIHGQLRRQCPATGCWFFLIDPRDPKAQELKVEMGDTVSRLPKHTGHFATVEGQLIKFGEHFQFIGVAVTFSEKATP